MAATNEIFFSVFPCELQRRMAAPLIRRPVLVGESCWRGCG